jgi:transposase
VNELDARIERLTGRIGDLVPCWSMAPVVEALQAMRGVSLIVASALVAQVGDFGRFDNPRQLDTFCHWVAGGQRRWFVRPRILLLFVVCAVAAT